MDGVWLALVVFLLRILNNAISTIRVVFIARQQLVLSAILALFESLIFAFTVANVVNDLRNPLMLGAYSGGYALGSYLGMWLEKRFVQTFLTFNIIAAAAGHEIALALRDAGFGVTETIGEGKDGHVRMLRAIVDRRDADRVISISREINPDAFIAAEETRSIRRGYFRNLNGRR